MQVQQAALDEAAAAAKRAQEELADIKTSLARQMAFEASGAPTGALHQVAGALRAASSLSLRRSVSTPKWWPNCVKSMRKQW